MPQQRELLVDERGLKIRHVTHTEAKKMVSTGEAVKVCTRCQKVPTKKFCGANMLLHDIVYQVTSLFRNSGRSASYITKKEMFANSLTAARRARCPIHGNDDCDRLIVEFDLLTGQEKHRKERCKEQLVVWNARDKVQEWFGESVMEAMIPLSIREARDAAV